jgi:hypothetical protein
MSSICGHYLSGSKSSTAEKEIIISNSIPVSSWIKSQYKHLLGELSRNYRAPNFAAKELAIVVGWATLMLLLLPKAA